MFLFYVLFYNYIIVLIIKTFLYYDSISFDFFIQSLRFLIQLKVIITLKFMPKKNKIWWNYIIHFFIRPNQRFFF